MRIEMEGRGSDSFYKEVINVASEYRNIINKPESPLTDTFVQMRRNIIICAVLSVFLGGLTVMYGGSTLSVVALVLNAVLIVFSVARLIGMNRSLAEMRSDNRKTALILDENGVAVEKDGTETVRIAWDNVAFVKKFPESIGFFASAGAGVITANRRYEKEILKFMKENKPLKRIIS